MKENPIYLKYKPVIERIKDAIDGEDAVKAKGEIYLPMLPGMTISRHKKLLYDLYLTNAIFYPATGRTFKAYQGTLFRKTPKYEGPERYNAVMTSDGQTLNGFCKEVSGTLIRAFRCGVLIDFPNVEAPGLSLADAERLEIRPYANIYPAENIVNWSTVLIAGKKVTNMVLLSERLPAEKIDNVKPAKDANGNAYIRRELILEGGKYKQNVYVKLDKPKKDGDEWEKIQEYIPKMKSEPLPFIPFVVGNEWGLTWDMGYPMLNDIVNLNYADYRNEALYRDALLFNGRPQKCVSGLLTKTDTKSPDGTDSPAPSIVMGTSTILQFTEAGKWGTLGGGADSQALKDAGQEFKERMALIGSRALAEDPRGIEAAETAIIHRQGEDGLLSTIADATQMIVNRTLEIMMKWGGDPGTATVTMNKDFLPGDIDPARLSTIWQMYVNGNISYPVFYAYLEKGEIYPDGWTKDKEVKQLTDERKKKEDVSLSDVPPMGEETAGAVDTGSGIVTLNGAQVTAAKGIVASVALGELSLDSGINMMKVFFNLTDNQARGLFMGIIPGSAAQNNNSQNAASIVREDNDTTAGAE